MILLIVHTLGLGFASGVMPGPLQTFLFVETLRRGIRRALPLALVPLASDAPVALACTLVLQRVGDPFLRVLAGVGAGVLLLLAWSIVKELRRPRGLNADDATGATGESLVRVFLRGVLVNLTGPGVWIFWATILGPLVILEGRDAPGRGLAIVVVFYAAFVLTLAATIVLFGQLRRLGPNWERGGLVVGLVALIGFAVRLGWQAATG